MMKKRKEEVYKESAQFLEIPKNYKQPVVKNTPNKKKVSAYYSQLKGQ